MLKITMNPRKKSKRHRIIPQGLRLPTSNGMDIDEADASRTHAETFEDNLRVMIRQEMSGKYSCIDYLKVNSWDKSIYPKSLSRSAHNRNTRIDEYCREQIVEWSFRVVDYFRIDREVVALSLSYLDRFLAICLCDRRTFKLAATTTLHLAVKLLYPCKLAELGILSDLSRGEFDMHDVSRMEAHILHTLKWNLHPPTSIAFATIFLDYIFSSFPVALTSADMDDMYDVSSFFCELAVCDYFFVTVPASSIALAAVLNSLEGMFGPDDKTASDILNAAMKVHFGFQHDLAQVRNRLWTLYERSEECALSNDTVYEDENHNNHLSGLWHGGVYIKKTSSASSPVSVSKHATTDYTYRHSSSSLRSDTSW
jgi:hypothetical protein